MQSFSEFIISLTPGFTPIIGNNFTHQDYTPVDLSEKNPELLKLEAASSEAFSVFINEYLKNKNSRVAFGGYNELRTLYNRSELFNNPENNRNIHIGLDIWAPAGTEILAPLDGAVYGVKDNSNFGDYGPTIILKHHLKNRTFYSLYGHLSRKSIENLEIGKAIKQNDKIAELGDFYENGDYAPHLHFQIMERLEQKCDDYPGVVKKQDLDHYLSNCPDPNLLLKI
ncbi:peptidoglycan DD-metalloendopeptidase family protein [Gramella sp. AN32]|uniref:Peptidoglycan DD-metalloendopeptidase family protein n=1 Tax=Christiangramia antarctica TaxID=2058158 RepID=A0ABW5X602_9FLAO|nr:peptidoglycan DD-metalloendopeptidase family protein [Gramella sp. AN32]MCM4158083.1 peptidase M23 [Gramella sp. AN32]